MATLMPAIPGYLILHLLGEGGMGRVYLAEDETLGRRVAIKMISPRRTGDPEAMARLLREARALATVEHPHVVRIHSYGEAEGQPYFVMEYVEGETLARRLTRLVRLSVGEALGVVRESAEALAAAWRRSIVHRDVKPSNILLDQDARVRVADFGLARPLVGSGDGSLTGPYALVGTPWYIAPELGRSHDADFRSDIYSLGIVLYEMLTGRRPFVGDSPLEVVSRHCTDPLPSVHESTPEVPLQVDALVHWMAEKDPDQRPPSYGALLRALSPGGLDALAEQTLPTSSMPSGSSGVPRRRRRRRLLGVALVTVVVLAATLAVMGLRRPAPLPPGTVAIAVLPFSGPDDLSRQEGRILASLVEQEVARDLPLDVVPVFGPGRTKSAAEDALAARERGRELQAAVVVFGDVVAFRGETELQARVAVIAPGEDPSVTGTVRMLPPLAMEAFGGRPLEARRAAARTVAGEILRVAACQAEGRGPEATRSYEALRVAVGGEVVCPHEPAR
jgi:predicted Ser/Thr protein kinase